MKFYLIIFTLLLTFTAFAEQFSLQPEDATVTPPATVAVTIMLTNSQPVYGFELTVKDTPEKAVFSNVATTSRTANALATSATPSADTTKIAVILSGTGTGITAGNGSVLKLMYSVSSGTGQITFTPTNLIVYNKNGTIIPGNTVNGTIITLQSSSAGSGSSGSGGSGGGGGGSGSSGGSSSSSGSSASTSTSAYAPKSFTETKPAKESPASQQPPKVIKAELKPQSQEPAPTPEHIQPRKSALPFIIAVMIVIIGALAATLSYVKIRSKPNREKYSEEIKKRQG